MTNKTFYITTALYYVTAKPHIGHSFEAVGADVMARYKRYCGFDVFFLTGTDEHGEKMEVAAKENNITPQELVDMNADIYKQVWSVLDISYDGFIRTTEPRHQAGVLKLLEKAKAKGDIYQGNYEGWYCLPCESYWTESQLAENKCCPQCQRAVKLISTPAYFFKLSAYQKALEEHFAENPDFIMPASRQKEMINNFLTPGLQDVCISRSNITWGIKMPDDPEQVLYVWFDALSNYITALDYATDAEAFSRYWPADIHVVGKDILRFHTLLWPAMLLSGGVTLPKHVFGHGFINIKDEKISKSRGNTIDPISLVEEFGSDAVRYFLMREIPFTGDGDFSYDNLARRYNDDLGNKLGNLLMRPFPILKKKFDGKVPEASPNAVDNELREVFETTLPKIKAFMETMEFNRALDELWFVVKTANEYVENTAPWTLAKDDQNRERLCTVLYNIYETLRLVSLLIAPFMPNTAKAMWATLCLGYEDASVNYDERLVWGKFPTGNIIEKGEPLFPRKDK